MKPKYYLTYLSYTITPIYYINKVKKSSYTWRQLDEDCFLPADFAGQVVLAPFTLIENEVLVFESYNMREVLEAWRLLRI